MNIRKKTAVVLFISCFFFAAPVASADDPFLTSGKHSGSFVSEVNSLRGEFETNKESTAVAERLAKEQEDDSSFKKALKDMVSGTTTKSSTEKKWRSFEAVDGASASEAYRTEIMREYQLLKMKREPARKAFGDRLGDLEKEIGHSKAGSGEGIKSKASGGFFNRTDR